MVSLIKENEKWQNALNLNMNENFMEDDIDEAELDAFVEEEPDWGRRENLLDSNINLNDEYTKCNIEIVNNGKIPLYLCESTVKIIDEEDDTQQVDTKHNADKIS